ncbi:PD-(D/E)XK nuclease family protein [Oscillatoriales cyanobacterium LEGE 11467]|uniref:PD-(D/E)XK nuclease family protein n=1 Tax=Zarconia navalis LEGE 11467 TaxID=1828826 RepID=A0A928VY68_9CYAN|nr:PD-(D/E)XK nuclease family protein [Zarconia navalis]MBE9041804.1 PD-(D/E)XK nuclease family protein [Zarconia navalis LEGE 11467]
MQSTSKSISKGSPLEPPNEIAPTSVFRLSQQHLDLLETCPRKFQQVFLERLNAPLSPERQESLAAGSRFHLLMQQRELGLPIESIVKTDDRLDGWLNDFIAAAPDILTPDLTQAEAVFRQAEHDRILSYLGFVLSARYDLLVGDDRQAQILDWKTYPRPQNSNRLAQHWQTRLYPYLLAETSNYEPEQISMTYWFVRSAGQQAEVREPQCHHFPYSRTQHQQTHQELTRLLGLLRNWLRDYQKGKPFPSTRESRGSCPVCQPPTESRASSLTNFDGEPVVVDLTNVSAIPEIQL